MTLYTIYLPYTNQLKGCMGMVELALKSFPVSDTNNMWFASPELYISDNELHVVHH